uniref:AP2/ERF domain-containing protein n=1 Tax=Setaria viridis TaxID=4556 RepID=A0A4U6UCA7_SETVI|nr:ethylene-responsive transcription factor ERF018-like [Setaria viridis]TKW11189.1 hypothetical protein SEVIR_6G217600v2 [Setaria viridis]
MARRGQAQRVGVQHHSAAAARQQKRSGWTGVRLRPWGRWAAEIRVPYTREKVWIGVFDTDKEAALAYGAAIFCFYGEDLPRRRRFNLPAVPHPDIAEDVRHQLSVTDIKDIAKKHARDALQEEEEEAAAAGPSAGADADAPANTYHGHNPNDMDVDLSL